MILENSKEHIPFEISTDMLQEIQLSIHNQNDESLQSMFDEKIQGFLPKIESRVALIKLIATVAPLLGLLRTVSVYWQQQSMAENAQEIQQAARELYERSAKFGEDLAKIGRGLNSATNAYNSAVGSYDRRVIPAGRRLETLRVADNTARKLEVIESVDGTARIPENTGSVEEEE